MIGYYRIPTATTGGQTTTYRPKYLDQDGVHGYSGQRIGESPQWVVAVDATASVHDDLDAAQDTTVLSEQQWQAILNATDALNGSNRPRNAASWRRGFGVPWDAAVRES